MRGRLRLNDRLLGLIGRRPRREAHPAPPTREPSTHVIVLDGTMSSLSEGCETNAGLTYKLLTEGGPSARLSVYYESGIQWRDWRSTADVIAGRGINRQIRRAYGFLASRYKPGDKIILLGYSRGAYAVRSLAGAIDRIGLLRAEEATVRQIRQLYRHYQCGPHSAAAADFARIYCVPDVQIEMVGVWDTVRALGVRAPLLLWNFSQAKHAFHSHHLGHVIRNGYHALALNETRRAYDPVLWESFPGWEGHMEQVWFRGVHADIGGHLNGRDESRPLSNIPLVWMLQKLERCGVALPLGWEERFPQDPSAPSVGALAGWGKFFISRDTREVCTDPSESFHESVPRDVVAGLVSA